MDQHTATEEAYCLRVLPHGINIISLTPKFAVSVCELHVSVFLEYQQCAFSFEVSHEPRNAHFGRDTDQNMYMIRTHFSFDYLHAFPLT